MDVDAFLEVSAVLVGFDVETLRASRLGSAHLQTVLRSVPPDLLDGLGAAVAEGMPLDRLAGDPRFGRLARDVARLWYLGVGPAGGAEAAIVSPEAYEHALVWAALGVGAPGVAAPGFGSWSRPPPSRRPG